MLYRSEPDMKKENHKQYVTLAFTQLYNTTRKQILSQALIQKKKKKKIFRSIISCNIKEKMLGR